MQIFQVSLLWRRHILRDFFRLSRTRATRRAACSRLMLMSLTCFKFGQDAIPGCSPYIERFVFDAKCGPLVERMRKCRCRERRAVYVARRPAPLTQTSLEGPMPPSQAERGKGSALCVQSSKTRTASNQSWAGRLPASQPTAVSLP